MTNFILIAALDFGFWWAVLLCVIALGLIIFVHELGHFLVAKACGVRCDKFYLGFDFFGLKLCKFRWGETEYGIGIFPLGGYVKMLGQEDNPGELRERVAKARAAREALERGEQAAEGDAPALSEQEIAELEAMLHDPRSYQSKSVPQRLAIIVAGVTMNAIFAFVAAFFAFWLGVDKSPAVIGSVAPGQSAWEAGMQTGDEVLSINGRKVQYFDQFPQFVTLGDNLDEGVAIVFRRDGEPAPIGTRAFPKKVVLAPKLGVNSAQTLVLAEGAPVVPASPAAALKDGFKPGDVVTAVNGTPVKTQLEYQRALVGTLGQDVTFRISRPVEGAAEARRAALRKLPLGDRAGYNALMQEYERGARSVDVTVPAGKMKHFGVIFRIGAVQALRESNGLSPAAKAGIEVGDTLDGLEIDGQMLPIGDPMTLPARISALAGKQDTVRMRVLKKADGEPVVVEMAFLRDELNVEPLMEGDGLALRELGVAYAVTNVAAGVFPGSQAEKDGVCAGDVLTTFRLVRELPEDAEFTDAQKKENDSFRQKSDTIPMRENVCLLPLIYDAILQPYPSQHTCVEATFRHTDPESKKVSTLACSLPLGEYEDTYSYYNGLVFEGQTTFVRGSFGLALSLGWQETWSSLTMVFRMVGKLGNGEVSVKGLGGPILIAKMAYKSAREGLSRLLILVCLISANLAVLNLLPIPVLDGGHVVFLLYEGVTGRAPNEKLVVILSYFGLLFFLALTIFVFGLDLGFIPRL